MKTIKIPSIDPLLKKLKKSQDVIAKEHDKLRDYVAEFEELADNCDQAIADIDCAIDSLSELV